MSHEQINPGGVDPDDALLSNLAASDDPLAASLLEFKSAVAGAAASRIAAMGPVTVAAVGSPRRSTPGAAPLPLRNRIVLAAGAVLVALGITTGAYLAFSQSVSGTSPANTNATQQINPSARAGGGQTTASRPSSVPSVATTASAAQSASTPPVTEGATSTPVNPSPTVATASPRPTATPIRTARPAPLPAPSSSAATIAPPDPSVPVPTATSSSSTPTSPSSSATSSSTTPTSGPTTSKPGNSTPGKPSGKPSSGGPSSGPSASPSPSVPTPSPTPTWPQALRPVVTNLEAAQEALRPATGSATAADLNRAAAHLANAQRFLDSIRESECPAGVCDPALAEAITRAQHDIDDANTLLQRLRDELATTPSPSPSPRPSASASVSPSASASPSASVTASASVSASASVTPAASVSASASVAPSASPIPAAPDASLVPSIVASASASARPSAS